MTSPSVETASIVSVNNWSGTNTHTITIPTASAGDLIVCVIGYEVNSGASPAVTSVVGASLGAFTKLTSFNAGITHDPRIEVWYVEASGAIAGEVITVTTAANIDDGCMIAFGVQNCTVPPNSFDPNVSLPATGSGSPAATPPTSAFSTSNANDLIIGIQCGDKAASGGGAPVGYTLIASVTNSGGINFCGLGVFVQSVSATQSGITFQAQGGSIVSNTVVIAHAFQNSGVAPPSPPNCFFKGIKNLFLGTYTTTYTPINGVLSTWTWSPNSLHPMEFQGWTDGSPTFNPTAAEANLFDFKKGVTNIQMGPVGIGTASPSSSFGFPPLVYADEQIYGMVVGPHGGAFGGPLTAYFAKYYAPLDGQAHTYPWSLSGPGMILPDLSNTQTFAPDDGMNWLMNLPGGAVAQDYVSSVTSLLVFEALWDSTGFTPGDITAIPFAFGFTPQLKFSCACPLPLGGATVWLDNTSGGSIIHSAFVQDFVTPTRAVNLAMENPASTTLDLNALFKIATNNEFWSATYAGFLKFYDDTQTFDGVVMNGYGILIAPDLSSYEIINVVPLDATAANWNSTAAVKFAKIDPTGRVWMNQPNFARVVLSGLIKDDKLTPYIPPVDVPIHGAFYR